LTVLWTWLLFWFEWYVRLVRTCTLTRMQRTRRCAHAQHTRAAAPHLMPWHSHLPRICSASLCTLPWEAACRTLTPCIMACHLLQAHLCSSACGVRGFLPVSLCVAGGGGTHRYLLACAASSLALFFSTGASANAACTAAASLSELTVLLVFIA